MSNPLVSVITPVYNGERYLADALRSLFAQDYEPFEAVVVDDGSTDRTPEIARSFEHVRYIRQENQGRPVACNTGVANSTGELIAWLDSDDVLPPTKLSVQAGYMAAHPEVGCVFGRQTVILEDFDAPQWMRDEAARGVSEEVPFVSMMVRREAFEKAGGFDASYGYAEDRDLGVRLREAGITIEVLEEVVLHRRFHGTNMVIKDRPANHPLLRSLKGKIDRSRAAQEEGGS